MKVGDRIKNRRIELGMSVDDVVAKLGINRATVYRYESNEIEKFKITVLKPLAKVLQTTPDYLMGWNENTPITPKEKRLAEAYMAMKNSPDPKVRALADAVDKLLGLD